MGGPKWKREVIQDHKFDFIDVKSFTAHGTLLWAGYLWVYMDILKSVAVYVLDTQTGTPSSLCVFLRSPSLSLSLPLPRSLLLPPFAAFIFGRVLTCSHLLTGV